ncbi:hypothetical protein IKG64_03240 [Candidatus Saccharibacteria bacterium]|nr:hypothetical protein [Candidatus Saccharibacteria bacterium]
MMKKLFISIFTIWVGVGGIFNLNYLYRQNDVYATEPVAPTDSATDDDPGTPTGDTPTEDEPPIISDQIPELYIKAINPGYTVDKISNVGEMIEIGSRTSDAPISLAGITIGYTNSSGNDSVLSEFPEHAWMSGETLLLRLASSPDSDLANITYTKTLAMKGGLTLYRGEEVLDSVCWTGKDDCAKDFKSAKPTVLVRNLTTGDFEHLLVDDYEVKYSPDNYTITSESTSEEEAAPKPSQCRGMVFSEILSYYETLKSEQFIEFHNNSAEQILTDGCQVRYKNKLYTLSGILTADGYVAYYPSDLGFNLTKNPTNSNTIELIDTDGAVIDKLTYPNGQRKATSYAFIGYDEVGEEIWKVTYAPTPGAANNYQEYKTCEAGKVINEATGNCVKVATVTEKVCKAGQYLNPLTGRCRNYPTTTEKTCKEGYYLNPDTGRCRKIIENTGADYSVEPESYTEESSFIALYAVLGVVAVGLIYLIYEFRHEIKKIFVKIFRRK